MIMAIGLALLPFGFVGIMATREGRLWKRQLQQIRDLPELSAKEAR